MYLLVLFIGVILIVLNVKAISKEKNDFDVVFKDRYNNLDDASLEIGKLRREFGETVFELQQEILELKKELETYNKIDKNNIISEDKVHDNTSIDDFEDNLNVNQLEDELTDDIEEEEEYIDSIEDKLMAEEKLDVYNEINFNSRIDTKKEESTEDEKQLKGNNSSVKLDEISKLLKRGLSVEEISEELNMGKGEVLLIIELYLK